MKRFPSILAVALLLAVPVTAGGLQQHRVPANARWVAHLDVEALRGSKLYAVVREESAKDGDDELKEGLAEFRAFSGLDPTQDFQSVTLYSTSPSEEACVALLSGNAKVDRALEKLRADASYHTTPVQSYVLHTWGGPGAGHDEGPGDTWYAYVHLASTGDERVVVASQDTAELVRGIAVLEKKSPSLSESGSAALRATPRAGSIVFAAAGEGMNELGQIEPVSAVAKLARSVVVDLGEDAGAFRARVVLETRTPEDAQRVHQVLQGAIALVGLVGGEGQEPVRAQLQKLVDALHLSVADTRVEAIFRYDVQALLEDLKSLERMEEDR